ncbi:MAG: MtaA/CmuA family methyltransferase [Armatimonadetes bacterium]|nr:MtaA/CmuA family methyltransferase [Armatimonadota bacterium]
MNSRNRALAALFQGKNDTICVGAVNQTATVEQMDILGVAFPEAHQDAVAMSKLAAGAVHLLGLDMARVPFGQTTEAEALGCRIDYGGKAALPQVSSHPYKIGTAVKLPFEFADHPAVNRTVGALRRLKADVGRDALVIGGVVGPFSLTGALAGTSEVLLATLEDTNQLAPLLEMSVEAAGILAQKLIEAGADAICVEDMLASPDMISPDAYREIVLKYEQRLFSAIGVPSILHICGDVAGIIADMANSGASALSIDAKTNSRIARDATRGKVALIGPLSPTGVLLYGLVERIRQEAVEAAEAGFDVVAPGCGIAPETPIANVKAMIEGARSAERRSQFVASRPAGISMSDGPLFVRYNALSRRPALQESGKLSSANAESPSDLKSAELHEVVEAVTVGDQPRTQSAVIAALEKHAPLQVVEEGLVAGITRVSQLWDSGRYFLPQVIRAADAMEAGVVLCEKKIGKALQRKGTVVMFVAQGDIHSIGKNIVRSLLSANGYEIIDLGIDVSDERVVEAVRQYRPILLIGSALMTTTMSAFPRVAANLKQAGIELPFACGGGAVTQEFCNSFDLGIHGGKASRAPAIAAAAAAGAGWREIRSTFAH